MTKFSSYISPFLRPLALAALFPLLALSLSSCFTGVEGTKKITLSKEDKRNVKPTAEELFFSQVAPTPLSQWKPGKKFVAADNKTILIFEQQGLPSDPEAAALAGKTLSFEGVSDRIGPDGKKYALLTFSADGQRFLYNTGKLSDSAPETVLSDAIPMMVDSDMIEEARNIVAGKKLWTRSSLWYDADGNRIPGRKFVPVTITDALPGSLMFPLKVAFTDSDGNPAFMFLNFGHSGTDSRQFAHIFSLSDIRKNYPHITDETWDIITREGLKNGMTKEECKLSLGNPNEVSSGHDYSQTLDLWHYSGGTVLWFEDGLLTRFRR